MSVGGQTWYLPVEITILHMLQGTAETPEHTQHLRSRPNNLAPKLDKLGIRILGTSAQNIDRAEDPPLHCPAHVHATHAIPAGPVEVLQHV